MRTATITLATIICLNIHHSPVYADQTDSITVEQAVSMALASHPAVQKAQFDMTAASAHVDASRSARYPDVSADGGYTRIGPVPAFDLPGSGSIEVAPHNNYDFHVGLRQTLYDFGRTNEAIHLAETSRQSASDNVDKIRFNIAYQTISVFNSILILGQRIDVLDEQLRTLEQHLDMSIRKLEAGTATDFDSLTIQVKIAVARNDSLDAARALEAREILFRRLTDLPADRPVSLRGRFASDDLEFGTDSLLEAAERQRPELILARDAEASASVKSRLASLGDRPFVSMNLATGFKNGYEPNLNQWRANYAAGLQLKIPIFNGHQTEYLEAEADANLRATQSHTVDLEKQIRAEVLEAVAAVNSSRDKISSTDTQVRQAETAVSMARVRYDAGVITNLDLLDAEMTLSQTRLIRLRALYNYTESLNELNRATGRKIW